MSYISIAVVQYSIHLREMKAEGEKHEADKGEMHRESVMALAL